MSKRKSARKRTYIFVIALVILLVVLFWLYFKTDYFDRFKSKTNETHSTTEEPLQDDKSEEDNVVSALDGSFAVHFLQLGNWYTGDCVLIDAGNIEVLIDAGSKYDSAGTIVPYVQEYCEDGNLEYVIATHAHQDHIAGFVGNSKNPGVFDSFSVGTIVDFALTNSSSKVYQNYLSKRDEAVSRGAAHYTAADCWYEVNGAKRTYKLADDISFSILYQQFYEVKSSDENNYSVCTLFSAGDEYFLFTGDLEAEGEESLVKNNDLPRCKLFKAGHHGSKTSSNEILLSKIQPEIVCVCCCAGNDEYTKNVDNQFPTQAFIDRIKVYTEKIYVTTISTDNETKSFAPLNGNIVVYFDGGEVKVKCSNNDVILKETEWFTKYRVW